MRSAAQLRDEIGLREASLVDARREHADGEIDDERFATIVEREESALATLREELAHVESQVSEDPVTVPAARRHRRRWLALALACFALAAGFLVWANLGLRQAGSSATGGLSLSQTQRVAQLLTEGEADIATGAALLTALSPFDVGQGVVIANGRVLAVEAAEGTDAMLSRVADMRASRRLRFKGRAGVFVKAAKRGQDMRLDLPTVGLKTLEAAARAELAGIAVAAGDVLIADRANFVAAARGSGLFVVGRAP